MENNPDMKSPQSDDEPLYLKQQKLKKKGASLERVSSNSSITSTDAAIKNLDPNCICAQVIDNNNVRTCKVCNGHFPGVLKLVQEKAFANHELKLVRKKLDSVLSHEEAQMNEIFSCKHEIKAMEEALEIKNDELANIRFQLEEMEQKLVDETERRIQTQKAKDDIGEELENLTQSLFEEANSLVANESRQRHGAQEKVAELERRLADTSSYLQVEQKSSSQLRVRLAAVQKELEDMKLEASKSKESPVGAIALKKQESLKLAVDDVIFAQFKELHDQAFSLRASKLHNLIYMKNALEDDVIPCLRFGGNPRTSTRKFIDAIIANTCFIEEMNQEQIKALIERDEMNEQALKVAKEKAEATPTPTTSLFNMTVLEKLTNAYSTPKANTELAGCSTCGKLEPYKFRFKISDVQYDTWYPICFSCRDRLLAVVDFYQFIRNIKQGLYPGKDVQELYVYGLVLKRRMFQTRVGAGNIFDFEDVSINGNRIFYGAQSDNSILPTPSTFNFLNKD